MAKRQPKSVTITKQPGQLSALGGMAGLLSLDRVSYPLWNNPQWVTAGSWRNFVQKQPIAILCRDAISNYLNSLDWAITARDSTKADELKTEIDYYTRLFERGNAYYTSIDFSTHIEFLVKDLFDLPFGTAAEIGREYNAPEGKVVWIRPIDGGTLAPTLDYNYPIVQHFPNYQPVVFPKEFITRVYLSPRTEIQREGWGMAPPEKIYLAMEMLNRGDAYYAQLLLNTPEAGILDLGDTEWTQATEWVKSAKEELFGINPMKIPVLAEHTTPVKWIPFGKVPSEIMYDTVTARYITILCAGYGLTPSDIGMGSSSNGGETLAGTIRQERISAKSGKALAKKKAQIYFENVLPDTLKFNWIDFDDEKNVAQGRARMATANAGNIWIQGQVFTPDEIRRQTIADGLFTIPLPETIDRKSVEWPTNALRYIGNKSAGGEETGKKGSNEIGNPTAPSGGGHGEIKPQQIISKNRSKIEVSISKAVYAGNQILGSLINSVRTDKNDFPDWEKRFENSVIGKSYMDLVSEAVIDDSYNAMAEVLERSDWIDTVSHDLASAYLENFNEQDKNQKLSDITKRAEFEFIEGKRLDLLPSADEMSSLAQKSLTDDLVNHTKRLLLEKIIPASLLVAEKEIISDKLEIDTTDITDNNTIKLARSVSEKVYSLLPQIVTEVGAEITNILGEK